MAAPVGIILAWPSTHASIPADYNRVTAGDGRFVRGSTTPGGTGGGSHTHGLTSHSHEVSHAHGASGIVAHSGTQGRTTPPPTNYTFLIETDTHSGFSFGQKAPNSGSGTETSDPGTNDPEHIEVIWIKCAAALAAFPTNALAFFQGSPPTGWSDAGAAYNSKFLKGAPALGNGGGSGGGAGHGHTMPGHSHSVPSHNHPLTFNHGAGDATGTSANSGGGANDTIVDPAPHQHSADANSSSNSGGLASTTPTIGNAAPLPPWTGLQIIKSNGTTAVAQGLIAFWDGGAETIPDGWVACDGLNGTPDLLGRFIRDGSGSGGSGTHTHSGNAHSHTLNSHTHTGGVDDTTDTQVVDADDDGPDFVIVEVHDHGATSGAPSSVTIESVNVGLGSASSLPAYIEWIPIMNLAVIKGPIAENTTLDMALQTTVDKTDFLTPSDSGTLDDQLNVTVIEQLFPSVNESGTLDDDVAVSIFETQEPVIAESGTLDDDVAVSIVQESIEGAVPPAGHAQHGGDPPGGVS